MLAKIQEEISKLELQKYIALNAMKVQHFLRTGSPEVKSFKFHEALHSIFSLFIDKVELNVSAAQKVLKFTK